ncbi:MAG TPA: class I SAM-dependent methyltransferase [Chloroflexia bacterium]|jgi:SAM-dependent methyltransferase
MDKMNRYAKRRRIDYLRAHLRKIAFESLYGPFAWLYDWVSKTFFLGQWRTWQRAALPHLAGKRVLEVGMGTGNMQIDLRSRGYEVWGVDLSPQMLRQAARKARRRALPPFWACRARAEALPFPAECFDSVVSTFPSEYIVAPATLSEIRRVLRPGARLVIVPAGWITPRDARGKAFEGVARLVYGDNRGGSNAKVPAATHKGRVPQNTGWVSLMEGKLRKAGFEANTYLASNERGSAVVVVADRG